MARPYTSIVAYQWVLNSGVLSKQKFRVYDFLFKNGAATKGEVTRALQVGSQGNPSFHRRVSELVEEGFVVKVGERPDYVSGRMAEVFDVAPHVTTAPPQSKPKRSLKKMEAALFEIAEAAAKSGDRDLERTALRGLGYEDD